MTATLALALRTRPDVSGFRHLFGFDTGISDENVSDFALQRRRAQSGDELLPPHLHRIETIAAVLRGADGSLELFGPADEAADEATQLAALCALIETHQPQLVCWDEFAVPVLLHRALLHGLSAPALIRLAAERLTLSSKLAPAAPAGGVALDELARLCGFAGRHGAEPAGLAEADALALYQMQLGAERLDGSLSAAAYAPALAQLRSTLAGQAGAHWQALAAAWLDSPAPRA